jgi:hypothetical protein
MDANVDLVNAMNAQARPTPRQIMAQQPQQEKGKLPLRYAAAMALVIIVAIGAYFYLFSNKTVAVVTTTSTVQSTTIPTVITTSVAATTIPYARVGNYYLSQLQAASIMRNMGVYSENSLNVSQVSKNDTHGLDWEYDVWYNLTGTTQNAGLHEQVLIAQNSTAANSTQIYGFYSEVFDQQYHPSGVSNIQTAINATMDGMVYNSSSYSFPEANQTDYVVVLVGKKDNSAVYMLIQSPIPVSVSSVVSAVAQDLP